MGEYGWSSKAISDTWPGISSPLAWMARMQKTFTADFLTGRREKNVGQLDAYLIEGAHEPIISKETFELVQKLKGQKKQINVQRNVPQLQT